MSCCAIKMPWHRPIHLMLEYMLTPRMMRVSGLEKFRNHALGHNSSISRTISIMTGKVRMVKNKAPGPPFSPRQWRTPYFFGTLKSCFHSSQRSIARLLMTKSAPGSTSLRSPVFSMVSPQPVCSFSLTARPYILSRFSGSISTKERVAPFIFGDVKMSRNVGVPNDMLPAPIKTILGVLIHQFILSSVPGDKTPPV